MEVRTIGKKIKHTMDAAAKEKLVREMRLADDKLCKGMFEFIDAQGGFLEFAYRKYPKEEISMYKFIHGEICEIPMGIVKHLNNTKKKVRRYNLEIPFVGGKAPRTFETISRVRFTPVDFL
jgi:hypothetical protein